MKTIIIPFTGFYGSLHSDLIQDAETQLFSDDQGTVNDALQERFYRACDYRHAHTQYAKAYAQAFAEKLELPLTFESLQSPREYNFTTDRIFCNIDDATVTKLHEETNTPTLRTVAAQNHTSRSGFFSYYSPDIDTWGCVDTWDHNQLATLLEAWMLDHFDDLHGAHSDGKWTQWDEHYLMQDYASYGHLDNWLCHAPAAARIANVASYLRSRAER
jgi:hypothetical protein